MLPRGLLLIGCGGHARSVGDIALQIGIINLLFFDTNAHPEERFLGFPSTNVLPKQLPENWLALPTSGNSEQRKHQIEMCKAHGYNIAILASVLAHVSAYAQLQEGTVVAHHAHVGPEASIGVGCIINTGAIVEHECKVGDFCHVSVNATVAGRCTLGRNVFVGAGATVIDGIRICDDVTIGAGAVVAHDITCPGIYIGIPAKAKLQSQS